MSAPKPIAALPGLVETSRRFAYTNEYALKACLVIRHELQVSAEVGDLCSCGDLVPDFLEHLGTVAQSLLGVPVTSARETCLEADRRHRVIVAARATEPNEFVPASVGTESPSTRIDYLIQCGGTDAAIAKRLFIPRSVVARRRAVLVRFGDIDPEFEPVITPDRQLAIALAALNKKEAA